MATWQIFAGSHGRDYSEDFIRYGLAFVGGSEQIAALAKVQANDIILLKNGREKVSAVGHVESRDGIHFGNWDKEWLLLDYDGWDLGGYVYVRWFLVAEQPPLSKLLGRRTIERFYDSHVEEWAVKQMAMQSACSIEPEPETTLEITEAQIADYLISTGFRTSDADKLVSTIFQIRRLVSYYRGCNWEEIREHETRTFLVIPLLLAMGWSEQLIKIEQPVESRGKVDIACFSTPVGAKSRKCVLAIETKGFNHGLRWARDQIAGYAESELLSSCSTLMTSNGYCYRVYEKDQNEQVWTQTAYMNLLKPRVRKSWNWSTDPADAVDSLRVILKLMRTQYP